MNRSLTKIFIFISMANIFGITALSVPVLAESDVQLEEVVVTARRRTELDQEVPIATSVFNQTTIQRAGIERPDDFINLTSKTLFFSEPIILKFSLSEMISMSIKLLWGIVFFILNTKI